MSTQGLAKWKDDFDELMKNLVKQMQGTSNRVQKEQNNQQSEIHTDQNKFLQQNHMSFNNQDVYQMKYLNKNFTLYHYQFNQRYDVCLYPIKLIDSFLEQEIDQKQYINPIFEFKMSDNNIILTIKHQYKENLVRHNQSQDSIMIKEIFVGFKKDEQIFLFLIKNIGICQQVEFHPLNPNYILILQTSQTWSKNYQHQKDQYFFVYQIKNPRQPIFQLNLEKSMDGSAISFTFSQDDDDNQFLLYFLNQSGQIYHYNLILPEMIISYQTKVYLQQNQPELVQFIETRSEKQFKIHYDCTTSVDYQRREIRFQKFQNVNFTLPKCLTASLVKMSLKNYYLFFIFCKLENGSIVIQGLIGQDLSKLFEIYQDEIMFQSNYNEQLQQKNIIHLNEPSILYSKNRIVHVSSNALDLPNRFVLLIRYQNNIITVDYSNLISQKQDQSPINVNCIDLVAQEDQKNPHQYVQQSVCLDLFNSKKILLQIINEKQQLTYKILPSKLFVALVDQNQELNKQVMDFYQEKSSYQILKKSLQLYKEKLIQVKEKKLPNCKTDDEIIFINEELMEDFQNSVKGAAIKIKLETENMYNDIETKIRGDLCGQVKRNLEFQKKVCAKNEKINSLLEMLKQTPLAVIHQQLKNQQKQEDLQFYTTQFEKVQEEVRQQRRQVEEQIQISHRSKQEIEAIQLNLIQQIMSKKE